ncbi:MAG TPA: hypothetical protein VGG56_09190 [Terracidiphilus sp.]|jgi:hypothetical protein
MTRLLPANDHGAGHAQAGKAIMASAFSTVEAPPSKDILRPLAHKSAAAPMASPKYTNPASHASPIVLTH